MEIKAFKIDEARLNLLLDKLNDGCTINEATIFAKISSDEFAGHSIIHDGFQEMCESLRMTPAIEAKATLRKGIKENPDLALKYLERKLPEEFAPVTKARIEAKLEVDDKRVILD